ncbi:hypothetical protein C6Q28_33030 [Burkholderia multivorans]|nr:hypothetical protein C6Q28_33030 [Burkholderia multivorans]
MRHVGFLLLTLAADVDRLARYAAHQRCMDRTVAITDVQPVQFDRCMVVARIRQLVDIEGRLGGSITQSPLVAMQCAWQALVALLVMSRRPSLSRSGSAF